MVKNGTKVTEMALCREYIQGRQEYFAVLYYYYDSSRFKAVTCSRKRKYIWDK